MKKKKRLWHHKLSTPVFDIACRSDGKFVAFYKLRPLMMDPTKFRRSYHERKQAWKIMGVFSTIEEALSFVHREWGYSIWLNLGPSR